MRSTAVEEQCGRQQPEQGNKWNTLSSISNAHEHYQQGARWRRWLGDMEVLFEPSEGARRTGFDYDQRERIPGRLEGRL